MENTEILFLIFIVLFCVCTVAALVFNTHSKSRIPLVVCAVSTVMVIAFSILLFLSSADVKDTDVKDSIPLTSSSEESGRASKGRKTRSSKEKTSTKNQEKSDDDTVYITRNGTKYHFSLDCGDYEFYECTLRQAKERGLEPCSKCAK